MIQTTSMILLAGLILGQADNPNYEKLKYFHNRAGTWTPEGTMGGEPIGGQVTYEWILGKTALSAVWDFRVGDAPSNLSLEIIAWDGKDQAGKSWTFSEDGGLWQNVFALGKDAAGIRVDGTNADGTRLTATGVSRERGADQWQITVVIPMGRAGTGGDYFATIKRTEPKAIDISADKCTAPALKDLQRLAGKWRWTGIVEDGGEQQFEGEAKWILGGKFQAWYVYRVEEGGKELSYMAIRGVDPATKKVCAFGFGDQGTIHRSQWTRNDKGWLVEGRVTSSDGIVDDVKVQVEFMEKGHKIIFIDAPVPQEFQPQRIE